MGISVLILIVLIALSTSTAWSGGFVSTMVNGTGVSSTGSGAELMAKSTDGDGVMMREGLVAGIVDTFATKVC